MRMGSRIRENVKHIFQCFCEVVRPQSAGADAWIIQKFPDSYKDEEVLKSVPKFAYPCEFDNTTVQKYSFVLTSVDSKWTFGFCRHDPKTETALVLLSYLPWHDTFYRLLDLISELILNANKRAEDLWQLLEYIYGSVVPEKGSLAIAYNSIDTFVCSCPACPGFELPSIPEDCNLTEYYNAVHVGNMITIFASMLHERRVIFISRKFSRLSACVQAANTLLYPMHWQHIFIPVLPQLLSDYLLAPMPFLIGVPLPVFMHVRRSDLGDVVIFDADNNTIETPFDDLQALPQEVVTGLKRQLRSRTSLLGDSVSRAFLRTLVILIGGYRDALRFQLGQKITFDQDAFVESRPSSMQPFMRKMLHLQIFQQFIEERLDILNSGLGFSDEFEMEAFNYCGKSSSRLKQQYKEWAHTMRKEGSAFFKTVRSKANPAVKSAVKSVKERGKEVRTAYKGIRSRFRESHPQNDHFTSHVQRAGHEASDSPAEIEPLPPYFPTSRLSEMSSVSQDLPQSSLSESLLEPSPLELDLMEDLQDHFGLPGCGGLNLFTHTPPAIDRTLKPQGATAPHLSPPPLPTRSRDCRSLGASPQRRTSKTEQTNLIELDSTPSDEEEIEFDPLASKRKEKISSFNVAGGFANPLYPYFAPKGGNSESSGVCSSNQDTEYLLKEYGLDFSKLSVCNGTSLNASPTSASPQHSVSSQGPSLQQTAPDPFHDFLLLSSPTQSSPANWTRFH